MARPTLGLGDWRERLSPLVYLSNNWISLAGVVLVTTAGVLWVALLPVSLRGEVENPYFGILAFLVLPGVFFAGLALIPAGMLLRSRREHRKGLYPAGFPPLDLHSPQLRRLLVFIGVTTLANLVIAGQFSYRAVSFMDSVTFCGQTCHTVMQPEFAAYQNSPHSRVECVKCHIGPGASWFVQSKLSGIRQVFAVAFHTYSTPIPTPVRDLRPARETCEACHWPQKFGEDRLRIVNKYADDEQNTLTKSVLLMRIGGGRGGPGIHGAHLGPGVTTRYAHSDDSRQKIPWIEHVDAKGAKAVYLASGVKPESVAALPVRTMDCMDCHNRPTHAFDLPERAVDRALASGEISAALPFAKKQAVELLRASYPSNDEAAARIPARLEEFYRKTYPAIYAAQRAAIAAAGQAVVAIHNRNVFPAMKVTWGTYPNNIGHTDFTGCFRCHDDEHASAAGKKVPQDCNTCHQLLAMDEPDPKILKDLGISP